MRRTSEEWSRIGYTEEGYIDWPRVMSYEAPYNLIIDARTRGKTYGLRKYALRQDYVRRHKRYVELTRTKSMLEGSASLQAGYFARFESDYCADPVLCDYLEARGGQEAPMGRAFLLHSFDGRPGDQEPLHGIQAREALHL